MGILLRVRDTGVTTVNYGLLYWHLSVSDGDTVHWYGQGCRVVSQIYVVDALTWFYELLIDVTKSNERVIWFFEVELETIHVFFDDFVFDEGVDEVVMRIRRQFLER